MPVAYPAWDHGNPHWSVDRRTKDRQKQFQVPRDVGVHRHGQGGTFPLRNVKAVFVSVRTFCSHKNNQNLPKRVFGRGSAPYPSLQRSTDPLAGFKKGGFAAGTKRQSGEGRMKERRGGNGMEKRREERRGRDAKENAEKEGRGKRGGLCPLAKIPVGAHAARGRLE